MGLGVYITSQKVVKMEGDLLKMEGDSGFQTPREDSLELCL